MKATLKTGRKSKTKLPKFVQRGQDAHQRATEKARERFRELGAGSNQNPDLISAIENKDVITFVYNGEPRVVEPQTYGISVAGHDVLRAYQRAGGSASRQTTIAKLFDVAKMSKLEKTGEKFFEALREHNPEDSAMVEIFATLPKPKTKV
ncbi:MAG TPA: hypothetical protein VK530_02980 [Candidatus Acidoferrum sp.]|nr:hypothetical protein [Candidatus Acidoferrum sp.]